MNVNTRPMPTRDPHRTDLGDTLANVLLGFFGVVAAFLLLPKTVKFLVRRFVLRLLGEVILFITFGLLTEKVIDWIDEKAPPPTPS